MFNYKIKKAKNILSTTNEVDRNMYMTHTPESDSTSGKLAYTVQIID